MTVAGAAELQFDVGGLQVQHEVPFSGVETIGTWREFWISSRPCASTGAAAHTAVVISSADPAVNGIGAFSTTLADLAFAATYSRRALRYPSGGRGSELTVDHLVQAPSRLMSSRDGGP
ncbi:hypothetical protein J4709_40775 [Actinomadura sp. LCR2-06]|uniref:Uncharacterized protein n=1 Tax=Actinomadura violacea TaxID=2819934 RepID=A0ABS3S5A5_9ACTN|nr:hypothetical protein [Actinomadura violacea]